MSKIKHDVFISRAAVVTPGLNLGVILNFPQKKLKKGEVGIEIEIEGKNLPGCQYGNPPPPWVYKVDHSLRGDEFGEYVLTDPIMFSEVPGALSKLWDSFEKHKTKFDDSNRTSVHIHLNCQRWHINRLAGFAAMYFCLEEVLTEWCGEHRVGNLFCLRAQDALAIITWMKKFINHDGEYQLPEGLHYAGLNPQALNKFGSLEVRTLRGVSNPNVIQDWVGIFERLYKLSGEYRDPREICYLFSQNGPRAFFDTLLGDKAQVVRQGVGMTSEQIDESMYAGIRRAQDIAFCRDWDEFKSIDISDNPFGYNKGTLLKKAMQANGMEASEPEYPTQPLELEEAQEEMPSFDPWATGVITASSDFNW